MRVKRQRAAPDQLLARGGHRDPKTIFKEKTQNWNPLPSHGDTPLPYTHAIMFWGVHSPQSTGESVDDFTVCWNSMISPSEYHPLPLTTSLLHFLLLRQRAGKNATRARKPRPATLGTCLEDMPSVVKVVKGTLRCVNGTAPPPRPICCLLPIFLFISCKHMFPSSVHEDAPISPCLHQGA